MILSCKRSSVYCQPKMINLRPHVADYMVGMYKLFISN